MQIFHTQDAHRGVTLPCALDIKEIDHDERTLVVTISSRTKDRVGDILDPAGAELDAYRKNPVVLWAHDYRLPPVAKTLWIKVNGDRVVAKPQFARTAVANEIFNLYAEGFLNAWSVGFIPHETEPIVENDRGSERRFVGYRVVRWELLEYSAVPVPANPEALTHALRDGHISSPVLVKAFEQLLIESDKPEEPGKSLRERDTSEASGKTDRLIISDSPEIDPEAVAAIARQEIGSTIRRLKGAVDC